MYFCLCCGRAAITPQADPSQVTQMETRHQDHPLYIGRDEEPVLLEGLAGRHRSTDCLPMAARRTGSNEMILRMILNACGLACRTCGEECERHAQQHQHCAICAQACRECERLCQEAAQSIAASQQRH